MKNCTDLNLGEGLCIFTFFHFPDSRLYLLHAFDFIFNSVTVKTCNNVTFFLHENVIAIFVNQIGTPF